MQVLAFAVLFVLGLLSQDSPGPLPSLSAVQSTPGNPPEKFLGVPADTKVSLALTGPVWSQSAKAGDTLYAVTVFPVAINDQMAIPPGTYVQGIIDTVTRPTWFSGHAELHVHFTQMIFANGYTVQLEGNSPASTPANPFDPATAVALIYVEVSSKSDILLDNGSQIEMILQKPLQLDSAGVAAAARLAKPLQLGPTKTASRCVPTPGTPGTDPIIIPGTPGTPGTPPTVIPGGPGMPDTVIPGTPPTVIGGSSGTPGVACPAVPLVTRTADVSRVQTKSFEISSPLLISGTPLAPGSYQIKWSGFGPARADILRKGKVVASAPMRVLLLPKIAAGNNMKTHTNPDGSVSVDALIFTSEYFLLAFD
jgi:hypothetical protein